ncbi:MAG: deoxyribonuclease IV [Candidatus Methanofastidiosia archaeon]
MVVYIRRLGVHVSIAGGVSRAIERQDELGGNCGQIFVSSPRAWKMTPLEETESKRFRELRKILDQGPYLIHSCYLVNLGTANDELFNKSIDRLQKEINYAKILDIEYVVFHPGSATGGHDRAGGIQRVAKGIDALDIPKGVKLLLENTAGKGTTLGRTFDELMEIIDICKKGFDKLGTCFDTCHAFCGGYPIHTKGGLDKTLENIDDTMGLENICTIHLNDSKHPFDSRKDEHHHIGMGEIGEKAFEKIVNDERLAGRPMILETPATGEKGYAWNIKKVKSMFR